MNHSFFISENVTENFFAGVLPCQRKTTKNREKKFYTEVQVQVY